MAKPGSSPGSLHQPNTNMGREHRIKILRDRISRDTRELHELESSLCSPSVRLKQTRRNDELFAQITSQIIGGADPFIAIQEVKHLFNNKNNIVDRLRWWIQRAADDGSRTFGKFFATRQLHIAHSLLIDRLASSY